MTVTTTSKVWLLLLPFLFSSCTEKRICVRAGLNVTCAPRILRDDQWAVMTILHVFPQGVTPVKVREDALQKVAVFAKRTEVIGTNRDGSGYFLQVYVLRPLGTNSIELNSSFLENAVEGLREPITIGFERTSK